MSPGTAPADSLLRYVLALADDNLILAQRLGALVAHMPDLEEDIAVANLGLDALGTARNLYTYASELDPQARTEDQFAMERSERDFFNAVLVEQPNGDFAHAIVRQFFVDAFQVPLYGALEASADERLRAIGAKAAKEASYHLDYSSGWIVTLGDGTDESNHRTQTALDALWRFTADLFALGEGGAALVAAGIAADPEALRAPFDETVTAVIAAANLTMPADPYQRTGGRDGVHTEHLGHLLPEMQALHQAHSGASW